MSQKHESREARRRERVRRAVELLAEEARERLARHPHGHLLTGASEDLLLSLEIPTRPPRKDTAEHLDARAGDLSGSLDAALEALLAHRSAVRPGVVYCLRCRSADCGHGETPGPRQVFAGYGATGLPRFQDLGQLLLELGEEQVDRLYGRSKNRLLARVMGEELLTGEVLDAYRESDSEKTDGYRLHGQVVAGWYTLPDDSGRPATLAVTLQIVSTQPRGSRRRFGVNVLGRTPDGSPLEILHDTLGEVPWSDSVRWAQRILDGLSAKKASKRRIEGILSAMARRLEKDRRARGRKTRHGRERHAQGDRPTPMALPDLARAPERDILFDVRAETLVVLGDRGRAHVFTPAGKLVTSVRYNPASIARRREKGYWRPARKAEAEALRAAVSELPS